MKKLKVWIQAIRLYSFPASTVPVLITVTLVYKDQQTINWLYFLLVLFGVWFLHAGTNLMNDYFDYLNGYDTKKTLGSSGVLTGGLLSSKSVLGGILFCYVVTLLIGACFVYLHGRSVLYLLLIGVVGSYFYTGKPFAFKYHALGEPIVFLLMGPLLFVGISIALVGAYSSQIIQASLPIAFLVTAILTANNIRDLQDDKKSGFKTIAIVLGRKYSNIFYGLLLLLPYVLAICFVWQSFFSYLTLLVFYHCLLLLSSWLIVLKTTNYLNRLLNKQHSCNCCLVFCFLLVYYFS